MREVMEVWASIENDVGDPENQVLVHECWWGDLSSDASLTSAAMLNRRSSFGEAVAIQQAQADRERARSLSTGGPPPERLRAVSDAGSVIASVVSPDDSLGDMPVFDDSDGSDDSCEL